MTLTGLRLLVHLPLFMSAVAGGPFAVSLVSEQLIVLLPDRR